MAKNRRTQRGNETAGEYYGSASKYRSGSRQNSGGSIQRGGGQRSSGGRYSTQEQRARRRQKKRKKRSRAKGIIKGIIIALFCVVLACCIAAAGYIMWVVNKAPDINTDNLYAGMNQQSIVFDDQGKEVEALHFEGGTRTIIKYDEMPEDMINAVVAIEDKTFWEHHGFNFVRMIGAIKDSVFGNGKISGTSTITQQLARNIYLSDTKSVRSIERKITEAYYSTILEKQHTKKQLMEAYLNTVYFGNDCYGVEAAAQNYFGKHAEDLDILECAALAALPKSPDSYALIKTNYAGAETDLPVIKEKSGVSYLYNGALSEGRRNTTLKFMKEDGFITDAEYKEAMADDLKEHMKVKTPEADGDSYYIDYAIQQVIEDLAEEKGIDEAEAKSIVYSGGLEIHTCLSQDMQDILLDEINNGDNYTMLASYKTNADGDILDSKGKIMARAYSSYFNKKGTFTLYPSEFKEKDNGDIVIKHGKRLALHEATSDGVDYVRISFRNMYVKEKGVFSFIEGGDINIPVGYTSFNSKDNCVVSAKLFEDYPDIMKKKDGKIKITAASYTLKQKMAQPQAAAAVMDNKTGQIKAMVGGRGAKGKKLYNRAIGTRQPGSNIKPIAVYAPALQKSVEMATAGEEMQLDNSEGSEWGKYITAGSIINDAPVTVNGKTWPKNSYSGFRGKMSLRKAVTNSVNVCAYKTFCQIGTETSLQKLKEAGISSIVEEGNVNDINAAALALGGMTNGISPLELTAAYAMFPNAGEYRAPVFYTEVYDGNGNLILESNQKTKQVYDKGVAWIMTSILQSVVKEGTGKNAAIGTQPVAGKTGTTTDKYDIWFTGFTPQYTMSLWEGNDQNIELVSSSEAAAKFWSAIMKRLCEGLDKADFFDMPSNVSKHDREYYVNGTYFAPPEPEPEPEPEEEEENEYEDEDTGDPDDGGDPAAEEGEAE